MWPEVVLLHRVALKEYCMFMDLFIMRFNNLARGEGNIYGLRYHLVISSCGHCNLEALICRLVGKETSDKKRVPELPITS